MSAQDVIEQSELKMVRSRPVTVDQILGSLELVTTGVGLDTYGVRTPTEHLAGCLEEMKAHAVEQPAPPAPVPAVQPVRPATPLEKREVVFASALETLQKQMASLWRKPAAVSS